MDLRANVAMARSSRRKKEQRILLFDRIAIVDLGEQFAGVSKLRREFIDYFIAYRIAAGVNTRPYSRIEILGLTSKHSSHASYSALDDALRCSTPSSVECSNCSTLCVSYQNGNTIRYLDREQHVHMAGDDPVALQCRF